MAQEPPKPRYKEVRDAVGIVHIDYDDVDENGEPRLRVKHLHDLRGTFITRLILELDLSDRQIAAVMGWSLESVQNICTVFVDYAAYAAASGARVL